MLYSHFYVVAKITFFTLLESSRNHFFQNIFGRALTQQKEHELVSLSTMKSQLLQIQQLDSINNSAMHLCLYCQVTYAKISDCLNLRDSPLSTSVLFFLISLKFNCCQFLSVLLLNKMAVDFRHSLYIICQINPKYSPYFTTKCASLVQFSLKHLIDFYFYK